MWLDMRIPVLLSFVFLLGADCASPAEPKRAHAVTDTDMCDEAEARLLQLGCRDSKGALLGAPNSKGVPFRERCFRTHMAGVWLNPRCIAAVSSCDEVDSCVQAQ